MTLEKLKARSRLDKLISTGSKKRAKKKTSLSLSLPEYDLFAEYCRDKNLSVSDVVDAMIEDFLRNTKDRK